MPRGGARIGAGRKPRGLGASRPTLVVDNGTSAEAMPARVPADLPVDQHGFWTRYAALAIEARTLTPRTAGAFRLLCELEAEKAATKRIIETDGRTYMKVTIDGAGQEHQELKAHPLTGPYRQLAQRVEILMARFGLAPFGKPVAAAPKSKTQWLDALTR